MRVRSVLLALKVVVLPVLYSMGLLGRLILLLLTVLLLNPRPSQAGSGEASGVTEAAAGALNSLVSGFIPLIIFK